MKNELKQCPFCGGRIEYTEMFQTIEERQVEAKCQGCGMVFRHTQDFAYSKIARVPRNESFETVFNRRESNAE